MDMKSSLPVLLRYFIAVLMSALTARNIVSPEGGAFVSQNIELLVTSLIGLGAIAWGVFNTPTAKALEVAREVDKKIPASDTVTITTRGSAPDIIVKPSGSE